VISSRAAAKPGSNAAREDAINGAPVTLSESFCRHTKLLESPQKVKALLGSFYSRVRLPGLAEFIFDKEHTEEVEAEDLLHFLHMTPPLSIPEVHNHLLSLAEVEREDHCCPGNMVPG